jgi:signal transduction histidine kinase
MPFEISHLTLGPFFGLATNLVMAFLCLATFALYRHYKPLGWLFLFYVFVSLFFFGYVVYVLQKSSESILRGCRIYLAALALLPAGWAWFASSLFNEKIDSFSWVITALSLLLAALTLLGSSPWLLGFPLEIHPGGVELLRPQSKLLRPLIQLFCFLACFYFFWSITIRLFRSQGKRPVYLLPFGIGLLLWLLGGLHDGLQCMGIILLTQHKLPGFASFGLSISLAIAIALHYRSLEEAVREESKRLNKVKNKALEHLSHEIRTPLALIQGNIRVLRRRLLTQTSFGKGGPYFEILERQLNRFIEIELESEKIIRSYQEFESSNPYSKLDLHSFPSFQPILLYFFAEDILENVKQAASHRDIRFNLEGVKDCHLVTDAKILEDILRGLLKNAIENTPDEGMVRVLLEQKNQKLLLKVQDSGIGITEENKKFIFDGLFHTQETDFYASKKPYDFNAGGKGLDLLLMKLYSQRLGFDLSVESQRCIYLITDKDLCPGRISVCPHCERPEDCFSSGGSTFYASFPLGERKSFKQLKLLKRGKRNRSRWNPF